MKAGKKSTSINKIIMFMLLVLLTAIIAGCSGSFQPNVPKIDYRTGTQGVNIDIKGEKEIIIYDDQNQITEIFDFTLENKGATDITENNLFMKIDLVDYFLLTEDEESIIRLESTSNFNIDGREILEGKSQYNKKGDTITHSLNIIGNPPPQQGATSRIIVDVCYAYKTILSDTVCVNTKVQKDGCLKDSYTYSQGQGAPIKISKVEMKGSIKDNSITPFITLTIENTKGGIFSMPEQFTEGCFAKQDINKLKISGKLGVQDLFCGNENENLLEFKDNTKVVCKTASPLAEVEGGIYDTPLYIELEYGYHENEEYIVNVKRESFTS